MQSIIHRMHPHRRRNPHIFLFYFLFLFQRSSSLSHDRSGMLLLLLLAIANVIIFFPSFHTTTKFPLRLLQTSSPSSRLLFRGLNTIAKKLLFFRALCEDTQKVVIERAGFGLEERRVLLESREERLGAKVTYIRDAEIIIDDRGRTKPSGGRSARPFLFWIRRYGCHVHKPKSLTNNTLCCQFG
jgi:hypothetical protein